MKYTDEVPSEVDHLTELLISEVAIRLKSIMLLFFLNCLLFPIKISLKLKSMQIIITFYLVNTKYNICKGPSAKNDVTGFWKTILNHTLFREIPILNIHGTVFLWCLIVATPDLHKQ